MRAISRRQGIYEPFAVSSAGRVAQVGARKPYGQKANPLGLSSRHLRQPGPCHAKSAPIDLNPRGRTSFSGVIKLQSARIILAFRSTFTERIRMLKLPAWDTPA